MNIGVKTLLLGLIVQLGAVLRMEAVRIEPGTGKTVGFNELNETNKSRFMQMKMAFGNMARKEDDVVALVKFNLGKDPEIVRAKDPRGDTLLSLAAAAGRPKVVEALLDMGSDPKVTNNFNQGPVERARAGNYKEVVAILLGALEAKGNGAVSAMAPEKPSKTEADEDLLARTKALKSTSLSLAGATAALKGTAAPSNIPTPPPLPGKKPAMKPAAPAQADTSKGRRVPVAEEQAVSSTSGGPALPFLQQIQKGQALKKTGIGERAKVQHEMVKPLSSALDIMLAKLKTQKGENESANGSAKK
jgi:hypothetical protein